VFSDILKGMTMQFHLNRLQLRRATVDGGEDYSVYFCPRPCPSVALVKATQQKSRVVVLQKPEKGTFIIIQSAYKLSEDFAKPYFHKY